MEREIERDQFRKRNLSIERNKSSQRERAEKAPLESKRKVKAILRKYIERERGEGFNQRQGKICRRDRVKREWDGICEWGKRKMKWISSDK